MTQKAYAIATDGNVLVGSLHEHARGALVNFLHVHVNPVPNNTPDEAIRQQFLRVHHNYPEMKLELVEVHLVVSSQLDAATVALDTADKLGAG